MTRDEHKKPAGSDESKPDERAIDAPRLTPQGRAAQGGAYPSHGVGAHPHDDRKPEGIELALDHEGSNRSLPRTRFTSPIGRGRRAESAFTRVFEWRAG